MINLVQYQLVSELLRSHKNHKGSSMTSRDPRVYRDHIQPEEETKEEKLEVQKRCLSPLPGLNNLIFKWLKQKYYRKSLCRNPLQNDKEFINFQRGLRQRGGDDKGFYGILSSYWIERYRGRKIENLLFSEERLLG